MKRWLGLSLIALLGAALDASATAEEWPLKQVFGKTKIGMVQTSRHAVVEYCPDDTCKRFMLEGGQALPALHDFVFLYLAVVGNFDIEQIKAPNGERYFTGVLKRQRGDCGGTEEAAVARCALASMAGRYPIRGFISKMDDGWRRSEPFDLKAEVKKAVTP